MNKAAVLWRVALLLAVFAGTGVLAANLIIAHAVARGSPEYAVRLAGLMAGLFSGGIAAAIAGVVLAVFGRDRS